MSFKPWISSFLDSFSPCNRGGAQEKQRQKQILSFPWNICGCMGLEIYEKSLLKDLVFLVGRQYFLDTFLSHPFSIFLIRYCLQFLQITKVWQIFWGQNIFCSFQHKVKHRTYSSFFHEKEYVFRKHEKTKMFLSLLKNSLALFHTFSLSNIVTIPLCVCLASSSILHKENKQI
jgi:hypothetical protein